MSKLKVLLNEQDNVTWHREYLKPSLEKYFEIHNYNPEQTYNAKDYIFVTSIVNPNSWYEPWQQQGAKIVYDALWEYHFLDNYTEKFQNSGLVSCCKYFFWINEYFVNLSHGYSNYKPDKKAIYKALMPIRQSKPHRQQLLAKLTPILDQLLYSQVDQGRFLPNDQSQELGSFQRYFRNEWYDSTAFSIVSETTTYSHYQLHVTEKSFKPLAFFHPFVTWGQTGTLDYLHQLGFETFENIFDESYDTVADQQQRLELVVKNIQNVDVDIVDKLTHDKVTYNHNLFYDKNHIEQLVKQGIVDTIYEYAETR